MHAAFTITVYLLRVNLALSLRARFRAKFSARPESENAQESAVGHIVQGSRERDNPCAMFASGSGFRKLETFSAIVDIQGQGPAGSELHLETRANESLRP